MNVTIKDYELTRQACSTALHQIYRGHHIGDPDQRCRVDAIYDREVPMCYKQFVLSRKESLEFTQPHFLLKEVFINPQCRSQFAFVELEDQTKYQPLNKVIEQLQPENEERTQLKKKLLWILRIVRLVPIVLKCKVMHDFAFSKIYCDEKENIYLGQFIKDRKGQKQFTQSEIEKNINQIISTLTNEYNSKQIGYITFSIANSLSHLKIVKEDRLQGFLMSSEMTLSFEGKDCLVKAVIFENKKQKMRENCWVIYENMHTLSQGIVSNQFGRIDGRNNFVSQQNSDKGNQYDNIEIIDNDNLLFPANLIGVIISKMQGQKTKQIKPFKSKGILISKNLVVTCAHSITNKDSVQICRLQGPQDITFWLNGKQYKVKKYRWPQKYLPKGRQQYIKLDYALLKLEEDIKMDSYIEIVKNYDKKQIGVNLIGPPKLDKQGPFVSKKIKSKQLSFQGNRIIFKGQQQNSPQSGLSGTPLFITAIEIKGIAKYYFMIGIFYGGNKNKDNKDNKKEREFYANVFNDDNIMDFANWQLSMANQQQKTEKKIFTDIFSFKNILNMDTELLQFKKRIEEIRFSDDQINCFSKMYKKVDFDKKLTQLKVYNMYFNKDIVDLQKLGPQKTSRILENIGSQTQLQRYNNIAFMYSIRKYQEWHLEFITISDTHGMFIITNYIFKRLTYFFQKAAVKNQHREQYAEFVKNCKTTVEQIYRRKKQNKVVRKKCYQMLKLVPEILKKVPLNKNFKKILIFLRDYAISAMLKFKKDMKQLFHLPKLLIYVFIGKMIFQKIAELDKDFKKYFLILTSILSICLQKLKLAKQEQYQQKKFKEIVHNFLWGVKEMITADNLKQIPLIDKENKAYPLEVFSQKNVDIKIQKHYFSQDIWNYLESYLKREKLSDDQDIQ